MSQSNRDMVYTASFPCYHRGLPSLGCRCTVNFAIVTCPALRLEAGRIIESKMHLAYFDVHEARDYRGGKVLNEDNDSMIMAIV
jgi:hypothetical protein